MTRMQDVLSQIEQSNLGTGTLATPSDLLQAVASFRRF
jgi:hypothetical protein